MNRRDTVLGLLSLGALPAASLAQQAQKVPLIGFLHSAIAYQSPAFQGLREGLLDVGFIEGKTILVDARWGSGKLDTLPGLVDEIVQSRASLVVTVGAPSLFAARQRVGVLPIVAADLETDPVASGIAASFARPGGTI